MQGIGGKKCRVWVLGDGSIDDNDDNLRPNQYPLGAQMDSNTTQRWVMGYWLWVMGDGSVDDNDDNWRGNQLPAPLERKQYYIAKAMGDGL